MSFLRDLENLINACRGSKEDIYHTYEHCKYCKRDQKHIVKYSPGMKPEITHRDTECQKCQIIRRIKETEHSEDKSQ